MLISKFTKQKRLLVFFFLSLILFGCQAQTFPKDNEQLSTEERIVIRFSHVVGEETPKGLAARKFAQLMRERTNGYVEVQVFANGFLYKDGEELEALLKGDLQMIAPATSKVTSLIPEWSVMDLPFAFETIEQIHQYLQGEIGEQLLAKFEQQGMIALGIWDNGFKQLTNRERPIVYPHDLSNLRIRIMPSDTLYQQFRTLGAIPKEYAFNEVFQRLENGDIDGQENTLSNISSKDLYSLQNYMTISNHGYLGYVLLMNQQFWLELPEEIQQLIVETLEEVTSWEQEMAQKLDKEKHQAIEECNCISIHYLSTAEKQLWEDALRPVYRYYIDRFGIEYIKHLPKHQNDPFILNN